MTRCSSPVYYSSPFVPAQWAALGEGGCKLCALGRRVVAVGQLWTPGCGRGSAPPLPWDLLLSARSHGPGPSQGASHSSSCFHPFTCILLFSLTLLPHHVSPDKTLSFPRSWQDPSGPPMATDSCHSTMGDGTFLLPPPPLHQLSPLPHQPFHTLVEGCFGALPTLCSPHLLPKAGQGHCQDFS